MMDELLSLIKENPRLTNAELAAALDRDEAQVAQQVRQYEADGVIKGYCAILDKDVVVRPGVRLIGTPENPMIVQRGEIV